MKLANLTSSDISLYNNYNHITNSFIFSVGVTGYPLSDGELIISFENILRQSKIFPDEPAASLRILDSAVNNLALSDSSWYDVPDFYFTFAMTFTDCQSF